MASEGDSRSPAERLEMGLAKLREGFADRLPERVEDLTGQWEQARRGGWSDDDLRALRRSAHGLMGTAGSLGFTSVAGVAHQLERLFVDLLDRDEPPTPDNDAEVSALISRISEASIADEERGPGGLIRDFDKVGRPTVFEPRNLIVIVEIEEVV